MPQYVNIRIFLSSNQILREINFGHFKAPNNWLLDHFCSSEFWIFGNVWHFQVGNFQNSKPTKLLKLANIDFRVAGIILFTLLVHKKFDNYFVKWSQCSKYKQAFENCNRYMYIHLYSVKIVELNFVWFEEKNHYLDLGHCTNLCLSEYYGKFQL